MTALVTPLREGRVDFEVLAELVNRQIAEGVDGIVSVGTTGESATLSVDEHITVIVATVHAARGRVPVIAGAGANATLEAIELTVASEEAGADALLHVTPYYNRPTRASTSTTRRSRGGRSCQSCSTTCRRGRAATC